LLLHSLALYIVKLLVPFQLSAIYLYPAKLNNTLPVWYFAGAATFILLFFATTWWYYKQHDKIFGKQVIAGFLFFLITISIVLPLQWSRTILIAERYSYLPHIGLIISFLLLFFRLVNSRKALVSKVAYSFVLVLGLVYAGVAWRQAKMWESPETLFTQVIENGQSASDKAMGYYNRGNEYLRRRNGEKAISDYSRSVELNPKYYQAFYNRGLTAYLMGNNADAIDDFSKSTSLYPDFADAYLNRGAAYRNMGMKNEALMDYSKALELKPSALGFLNRGILYYSNFNNAEKACSDWGKAYEMGSVKAYELLNQYCVESDTIQ
jgi:tetratricopeptide (TPR) repeat protein